MPKYVTPDRLRAIGELLLEVSLVGVAVWRQAKQSPDLVARVAALFARVRSL